MNAITESDTAIRHARSLYEAGDFCGAEDAFRRIILSDMGDVQAILGLGNVYHAVGMFDEAEVCYRKILDVNSNNVQSLCNLGGVLWAKGELEEAERILVESIHLDPSHADSYNNLGVVLYSEGFGFAAEARYRRAIDLDPGNATYHLNRGMNLLRMGDFDNGCSEYEWRWKCGGLRSYPEHTEPMWDGSPLDGKTILLHGEQGLGDTIQFVRYASLARAPGGRVILECQRPLAKIDEKRSCETPARILPACR